MSKVNEKNNVEWMIKAGVDVLGKVMGQLSETHKAKLKVIDSDTELSTKEKLEALEESNRQLVCNVVFVVGAVAYVSWQLYSNGAVDEHTLDTVKKLAKTA